MHVILDFDGTITVEDTIGKIAEFALSYQKGQGRDFATAWRRILTTYLEESDASAKGYSPAADQRDTLELEKTYLRGRKDIEDRSPLRIEQSGLFIGLDKDLLYKAGQEAVESGIIELRTGFREFIAGLGEAGASVTIVSVNWSASFIRGVIDEPGVEVVANEITPEGKIIGPDNGTDAGQPILSSSGDKLAATHSVLARSSPGSAASVSGAICFGDSTTDLECLASVGGVAMSDDGQGSLLSALRRIGFDVPHVSQGGSEICWARDFREVMDSGIMTQRLQRR